jgi:hypothetical protein
MGEPVDIEMAIMDPSTPIDRILALVTNRIISEPTPQTAQAVSQFAETLGSVINQTVEGAAPPAAPVGPGGPLPPGAGPVGPPAPGGPPGLPPV